jgi:hypothetical protein
VRLTFILSYILEGECEAGVLALDDAHLAEGALADDTQQAEVVEVHCGELSVVVSPGSISLEACHTAHHLVGEQHARPGQSLLCSQPNDAHGPSLLDYAPWSVKTTGLPLL